MATSYVPGTCNIGSAEIAQRRRVGWAGVGLGLLAVIVLIVVDASPVLRTLVFLPFAGGAIGLVQARRGFCMAYGWLGVFNFDRLGKQTRVSDENARRADRAMAIRILLEAIGYAFVVTLVFYFLG